MHDLNLMKCVPARLVLVALLSYILQVSVSSADVWGNCGSSRWDRIRIPEYACFDQVGVIYPYALCVAGAVAGIIPRGNRAVYFGHACVMHDNCYSNYGSKKSTCDRQFGELIAETCDYTLDGKYRDGAKKTCRRLATRYQYGVERWGCDAFKSAQKKAGNNAAVCD